jgi:hypothetical protein
MPQKLLRNHTHVYTNGKIELNVCVALQIPFRKLVTYSFHLLSGVSGYRRKLVSHPTRIIGGLLYDDNYTYKIPTMKCSKIIFRVIAFDTLIRRLCNTFRNPSTTAEHHGRQDKCFMENWELGEPGPLITLIKADASTGPETNQTTCPYIIINLLDRRCNPLHIRTGARTHTQALRW